MLIWKFWIYQSNILIVQFLCFVRMFTMFTRAQSGYRNLFACINSPFAGLNLKLKQLPISPQGLFVQWLSKSHPLHFEALNHLKNVLAFLNLQTQLGRTVFQIYIYGNQCECVCSVNATAVSCLHVWVCAQQYMVTHENCVLYSVNFSFQTQIPKEIFIIARNFETSSLVITSSFNSRLLFLISKI